MDIHHIIKTHRYLLFAAGLLLSSTLAAQAKPRSLQIPWSNAPLQIQMDGTLNDAAWKDAGVATDFVMDQTSTLASPQTTARVLADSQYLYVGMTVQEPDIDKLVHAINVRQGSLWNDDCVELYLDPTRSGAWAYHWVVNPNGALWEGMSASAGGTPAFKSTTTAAAHIGANQWTCELKIPWKALMVTPQPGQWMSMNFTRERKAGGGNQLSAWSPTRGKFSDPNTFASAALGSTNGIQIVSLGSGSSHFNKTRNNQFSALIPAGQLPVKVQIFAKGKVIASARADYTEALKTAYAVPSSNPPLRFRISQGTKVLFATTLNAPVPAPRVWQVPDPLYKQLLEKGAPASRYKGVLVWGFNLAHVNILRQTARRMGIDYSLLKMHQQAGQYKMRILGGPMQYREPKGLSPSQSAAWKKADVKFAYMLYGRDPWIIDPKAIDNSMSLLDKTLTTDASSIWGVTASDEALNFARYQGANLMATPPANYPFLQQADNEVRTEFGGGKWGIPHGQKDPNPYRWIAFNKWLNVQIHNRTMRMRAIVKKHHLDIPIISFDPVSSASGDNYSTIASDYDIFTHQVFPLPDQWRPRTGFFTKVLVDLTGKDVWPCVHVEDYSFGTTPSEARELLSEVFRNGGTGFHLYWDDVQGGKRVVGDTRLTPFGSPRRYNTLLNTIKLTATMPKLRFPKTRTAILYNDDMLQSSFTPNLDLKQAGISTEAAYTFLGPVARSWFTFIDDAKVLSSPSLNQKFDTIYVPVATFQRLAIVAKLKAFVQNGGILICGDANAFSTDTLGNDTSAQRSDIFGVTTGKDIRPKVLSVSLNGKKFSLPMSNSAALLTPLTGTRILATFDGGSPAITAHSLGRGQAILFATNPFHFNLLPDSQWRNFFTAWVAHLKDPTGLNIWRFQLPNSVLGKDLPTPPGKCLTNNHVIWQEEKPVILHNVNLNGKYQLQPAPDAIPDANENWISFTDGHLTDRRKSMLDSKTKPTTTYSSYKNPDSRWMDSWKSTSAVTLTYDLQKPITPNAVKFWFDDTMPKFTVQGSNDLQHWQSLGENMKIMDAGENVLDVTTSLHATTPCRYVRVVFAPRNTGQKLTLIESEVWGK